MSVAPHSTSPNNPARYDLDDPEYWEIKPLGWRLIFSDRLLWLAIGLSFAAHLLLLAPRYGIRMPHHGDHAVTVFFRAGGESKSPPSLPPTPTSSKTERQRADTQARITPPQPIRPSSAPVTRGTPAKTTVTNTASAARGDGAGQGTGNRRVTLTPGMKDYRYSQYLDDWRRKVERIGAMNYPDEARGKFFGSLVLSVALRPDGSVDRIIVIRSSGNPVLDEAAKRIVTFASPFAPFPPDIRKETDYLDITRTWTFTRNNALETR